MIRHSHLAPMELYAPISNGPYAIEPYEAGWAREAIAFVYVTELCGSPRLDLRAQISADGQRWLDFGPRFETITKEGGYFLQLTHFGTWLRLAGEVTGGPEDGSPALVAAFYWDLKE